MHNQNEFILEEQTAIHSNETVKRNRGFADYLESFGKKVFPYGNATHAFVDILFHLNQENKNSKPNIIMPSYIPAKLFRIIITAGYIPVFYEIKLKCEFDINEIAGLIDDNTKGIFVIHYFGRPANIHALKIFADEKNIPLIEDCAHVLYGDVNNQKLGSFGDYSIFSVRKMLTLSDGGYLVFNNTNAFMPSYTQRVSSFYTAPRFLQSRSKQIYFKLTGGHDLMRLARLPERGYVDFKRAQKTNIKNISSLSSFYSNVTDVDSHVQKRRKNYNYLLEATKDISFFKPIYNNKPDHWTPYSFPVLVEESRRDEFQLSLLDAGISCGAGWPESPFEKYFTQTQALANSLIEFPVHPLTTEKQLDRIIDSCFEFEKKHSIERGKHSYHKTFLQIDEAEGKIRHGNENHQEDISLKIISSDSGFDDLKNEWIALSEKSSTSIFQTYEWQRLWWKYYGDGSKLYLILFYKADELIGIAPFFIDIFSIGKFSVLRRLRFLGSNASVSRQYNSTPDYGVSDYLDMIILPGYENAVAKRLLHHLKNNPGAFDIIELDEVSRDSNIFNSILPLLDNAVWHYKIIKREICPRILVLGTLADFMRSLSSKIRYQLTKIRRDRIKDSIFEVNKVRSAQELKHEFDEFVKLHQQRWNAQGLPGAFVDSRFKNFLKEISELFLNNGWLYLTSANSKGKCLAIEYAFKYKNNYYDYLKAFDDQSPYAKYRPGRALLLQLIEEAIEDKASVVDLLRGSEPYKFEIATDWHWVHKITIGNPVYGWRFRYNIFLLIFFFSLLNHRIKKEIRIAHAQWTNFGLLGFASHYFPMTMKKLKNKYFTPEHISSNRTQSLEIKPQKNKPGRKDRMNELREKVL